MSARRLEAMSIGFPLIDALQRPLRKSGVSFSAGDVKISKDGGSAANTSNLPSEIGTTGRYKLDLTATEMDAEMVLVWVENASKNFDPYDQQILTDAAPSGTAITGTLSTTQFTSDRAETATDKWKYALVRFATGNAAGEIRPVTAYDGSTKMFTVSPAFSAAPANGDRFLIVNL